MLFLFKSHMYLDYYQKLLELEKVIVHGVARGDKQCLKQVANRKAQTRKAFISLIQLICALRFRLFQVLSIILSHLTHTLLFYFQQFLVIVRFLFWMQRRTVKPYIRLFTCLRSVVVQFVSGATKSMTSLATESVKLLQISGPQEW